MKLQNSKITFLMEIFLISNKNLDQLSISIRLGKYNENMINANIKVSSLKKIIKKLLIINLIWNIGNI